MQPQTSMRNIIHMINQTIRIAKLYHLIEQPIFADSNTLLTPIATFGCFSIQRTKVLSPTITNNQSINALSGIILQCAFCNVIIHLSDMASSFSLSNDPKCTMEFIATLSAKHKSKCKGFKGADHLREDELQFGISEGSLSTTSMKL